MTQLTLYSWSLHVNFKHIHLSCTDYAQCTFHPTGGTIKNSQYPVPSGSAYGAQSRQRQREVSYIIHAILRVFSDHCDRYMTESLRSPANTHAFTCALHIDALSLSLTAVRKQLESSHVTFNTLLQYDTLRTTSQCCVKVLLLTAHYTQKHTLLHFRLLLLQCVCSIQFKWCVCVCMMVLASENPRCGHVQGWEPRNISYLGLGPLKKEKRKKYVFIPFGSVP